MSAQPKKRSSKRRPRGARRFALKGSPVGLAIIAAVAAVMFAGLKTFDVGLGLGVALCAPLVLAMIYKFLQWTRRHIAVGIDGLRVVEGFSTELIPFSKISSVAAVPRGLLGWQLLINFKKEGFRTIELEESDRPEVEKVAKMIERKRHNETDDRSAAALLGRRGTDAKAWRAELSRLLKGNSAYRGSELTIAEAKNVLADAGAPLDARVGAAVALRAGGQTGAMKRLRVVANEVADRDKRHALRRIADAEDETAIEEAMGAMFANELAAERDQLKADERARAQAQRRNPSGSKGSGRRPRRKRRRKKRKGA